jgi:transcriptional regulator with XRE-family HTH domain
VRHLRTARGWTQDDLARRMTAAGHTMHQTTVAKLELGVRPTGVDEITDIAAIFGIQPAALFEELGEEQELRQQMRELRARMIDIVEERDRLRSRLKTLEAEYKSTAAESRRLGRLLGEEVNDIG